MDGPDVSCSPMYLRYPPQLHLITLADQELMAWKFPSIFCLSATFPQPTFASPHRCDPSPPFLGLVSFGPRVCPNVECGVGKLLGPHHDPSPVCNHRQPGLVLFCLLCGFPTCTTVRIVILFPPWAKEGPYLEGGSYKNMSAYCTPCPP